MPIMQIRSAVGVCVFAGGAMGCGPQSLDATPSPAPSAAPADPAPAHQTPAPDDPLPESEPGPPDASAPKATQVEAQTANVPAADALPPWRDFTRVAKEGPWRAPARASSRAWIDTDHAVAVVRTERGEGMDAVWRITLIRLARSSDGWTADGTAQIEQWNAYEDLREGSISVHLRVEDIDDDGKPEVLTRHRLAWMCGGGGATQKRTLVIVNTDRALTEAAYIDLDEEIYNAADVGRERFDDRTSDGHRDLVVTWRSTYEGKADGKRERVFAWDSSDRFVGAERPTGEQQTCE